MFPKVDYKSILLASHLPGFYVQILLQYYILPSAIPVKPLVFSPPALKFE